MSTDIDAQVAVLQQMTLARLRNRYAEVFGEPTVVTNNKTWLVKRIAWRLQALAEGDLSERARQRAAELAQDADLRILPPRPVLRFTAPGGRLGLIVPAHPRLYGRMDQEAGHYRRYTRAALRRVVQSAGWTVESCRYINALGAAGWWYHNRMRRAAGLNDAQVNRDMRRADRWLAAVARGADPLLGSWFGLSVAAIARR